MKTITKRPAAIAGFFAGIVLTVGLAASIQAIYAGGGLSDDPRTQSEIVYPNW